MIHTNNLEEIKKDLQNSHICILPTDTILGLFADALNFNSVEKIFTAKQRDRSKPLAIFVNKVEDISKYAIETNLSKKFAKENLPGAYTILLHASEFAKNNLSPLLISHDGKIGIRIPKQDDILYITKEIIICGTSVNISGQNFAKDEKISLEIAKHVKSFFISARQNLSQKPSTIIDFTQNEPKIVR